MLVLLILLLRLVPVLLAGAVRVAVLAVVPVMSGVTRRRFRLGRRLGGLLRDRCADADNGRCGGTESEVANCFQVDLLWLAQELPAALIWLRLLRA